MAVDVGDMGEWMEVYPYEVGELSDAIESRLENSQNITLPAHFHFDDVKDKWATLIESI